MKQIRLVHIVTHPITAKNLMRGQLAFMRNSGMDVYVISSPSEELKKLEDQEQVSTIAVRMQRDIHLLSDFISFLRLYSVLRRLKPDIVHASTPKAGLLGMAAARLSRTPVRFYTLRGLRLETTRGIRRLALTFAEKIASACAHRIICVSKSLKQKYLDLGLADPSKTIVLRYGSSNGIDTERFPYPITPGEKTMIRSTLGIPADARVIGFLGRLTRDKGIVDLLDAFESIVPSFPNLYLLLVGDFEMGDPITSKYMKILNNHRRIIRIGFQNQPMECYAAIDVLILPSYREGFPNAPLEAAALGIPTVAFSATGTMDAIEHGITGQLVAVGDTKGLAEAIKCYLDNEPLRKKHGEAARQRILERFRPVEIWCGLLREYAAFYPSIGKIEEQSNV